MSGCKVKCKMVLCEGNQLTVVYITLLWLFGSVDDSLPHCEPCTKVAWSLLSLPFSHLRMGHSLGRLSLFLFLSLNKTAQALIGHNLPFICLSHNPRLLHHPFFFYLPSHRHLSQWQWVKMTPVRHSILLFFPSSFSFFSSQCARGHLNARSHFLGHSDLLDFTQWVDHWRLWLTLITSNWFTGQYCFFQVDLADLIGRGYWLSELLYFTPSGSEVTVKTRTRTRTRMKMRMRMRVSMSMSMSSLRRDEWRFCRENSWQTHWLTLSLEREIKKTGKKEGDSSPSLLREKWGRG